MNCTEPRRLFGFRLDSKLGHAKFNSVVFSPDGRRIAFTFYSPRGSAIGIMDCDGTNVTLLARSGSTQSGRPKDQEFWYLQFVLDGTHLLYNVSEEDDEVSNLCLMDVATRKQTRFTQLGRVMRPTISPDGTHIVCESWEKGTANLWRMTATGQEVTRLTHTHFEQDDSNQYHYLPGNIYPSYRPDGKRLVFLSSDYNGKGDNTLQVCVMHSDGTEVKRLTDLPANCGDPIWHPDGKQIAFTTHAELDAGVDRAKWKYRLSIYLVNDDGSDVRCLEGSNSVNRIGGFSPSGRYLVYASSGDERFEETKQNWDIRLLDLETGFVHNVTDDACYNTNPLFSPDGKSILFLSERDGYIGLHQTDIEFDD